MANRYTGEVERDEDVELAPTAVKSRGVNLPARVKALDRIDRACLALEAIAGLFSAVADGRAEGHVPNFSGFSELVARSVEDIRPASGEFSCLHD